MAKRNQGIGASCIFCDKEIMTRDIYMGSIISLHEDATHLCHNVCLKYYIHNPDMISIYGLHCPKCMKNINAQEYVNVLPLS